MPLSIFWFDGFFVDSSARIHNYDMWSHPRRTARQVKRRTSERVKWARDKTFTQCTWTMWSSRFNLQVHMIQVHMTFSSLCYFVFGEIPTLNSLPLSISGQDLYRRERTAWRSNVGVRWWLLVASHLQWWSSSRHHLKRLDRTWMAFWRTLHDSVPCFSGVRGGSRSLLVRWWSYIYTEYVI